MYNSLTKHVSLGLLMLVAACGDAPEYRVGLDTEEIQFEFFDEDEGVFPSLVTLTNPRNPFREFAIGDVTKFEISDGASNAGAFYAWATLLAQIPIGENQFFAALKLKDIYDADEVALEDSGKVKQMAIDGFQALLDDFPDSLLFDASGKSSFRLATPAYLNILELGGKPLGDWELVTGENGQPVAVQSTDRPRGDAQ